ncbi:hypothetical protein QBC39DRAFT_185612 [Podospora conica]|nr:hypothetical protein QBC39DRAFT_185612 [Schizothecium conicum]
MARVEEEANARPPWDEIEAKYWESTRAHRQEEDSARAADFADKIQEVEKVQMQLGHEREAFLDEMRELEARLTELREMAERKQRGIDEKAKETLLLRNSYEQMRLAVLEQRALEDEERRDMFAKYRADDVQAFRPADAGTELEADSSATATPPPARLEIVRDMEQDDPRDGQQKGMAPPPTQPETRPDVNGHPPRQTEAVQQPQTQPEHQPALQLDPQHALNHSKANGQHEPLPQPEADMSLAPLDVESIQPGGEGMAETGDALVTPRSRRPSSDVTSRLSTPPSEPQMDIDLVSLSRGLQPIGQLGPVEKPADPAAALTTVVVVDGAGTVVGEMQPLNFNNHYVETIVTLPIQRHVQMRPGKKFTPESLEALSKPSDHRGAKWLSCYIQATGEVQATPCSFCNSNVGPFKDCVLLNHEKFPRCGCCQWTRRACSFAEARLGGDGDVSIGPSSSRGASESVPAPERSVRASGGFTAVNASSVRPSPSVAGQTADDVDISGMATGDELKPKRKKTATKKAQAQKRKSDVDAQTPDQAANPEDDEGPKLPEITKEVLILRDDGVVFTDPPAMRGVPLAKIKKGDAYWDDEWPDLEATVAASLGRWEAKHEEHITANSSTSSKFLANRQINRGKAILKFLEEGELHPFQIMGKEHVRKTLANYDKLFRMTQILDELTKFKIDVTPSQWLRHRLCEVLEEKGDKFDLAQTVNDLYHDPKVVAIRYKSGFGNIGRPPGYKPGVDGEASSAKKSSSKRKKPHATPKSTPKKGSTSSAQPGAETETPTAPSPSRGPLKSEAQLPRRPLPGHFDQQQQPAGATENVKPEAPSGASPDAKKARLDDDINATLAAEDLDCDGYTTTDSFSQDRIHEEDWRLHQVKHAREQTDAHVTQYWHWIEEEQTFEHQVLSDESRQVKWGVYKEPHDFHLRLGELREVTMARGSNKVVVGTREYPGVRPRGELLVDFKRDRTKRRFLKFLKKKGVKLVKTTDAYVEDVWTKIEPSFSFSTAT